MAHRLLNSKGKCQQTDLSYLLQKTRGEMSLKKKKKKKEIQNFPFPVCLYKKLKCTIISS